MDDWAWEPLEPWLEVRVELPVGPLFGVVNDPTGGPWSASAARSELLIIIQRQLGHTNLGIASIYTCKASTTPRSSTPCRPALPR
jgi:hypothetical protein